MASYPHIVHKQKHYAKKVHSWGFYTCPDRGWSGTHPTPPKGGVVCPPFGRVKIPPRPRHLFFRVGNYALDIVKIYKYNLASIS